MHDRIRITATAEGQERVLTDDAVAFLLELHDAFECTRQQLLQDRRKRRAAAPRSSASRSP